MKNHIIVYLDSKQQPTTQNKATLKKVVKGTDRQSFFLALMRYPTSRKVSYQPMKEIKISLLDRIKYILSSFNEW